MRPGSGGRRLVGICDPPSVFKISLVDHVCLLSTGQTNHREFVMRNKIHSKESKRMSTAYVTTAKGMATYLLSREHRGPGDTIEEAAHRIQTRFGVPVALLMRLRHREVKDMLASNFFSLANAFNEAMERAEKRVDGAYRHEKDLAIDPKIVRVAAALAGEKGEA